MSTPSTEAPVALDLARILGGPVVTMLARAEETLLGDVVDTIDGPIRVREIVQRRHYWDLAGDPPGHHARPTARHRWPSLPEPLTRRILPASETIRIRRPVRDFGRLKGHTKDVRSHNPVKRGWYTHVSGYTAACSCSWKAKDIYSSKGGASDGYMGHKAGQFTEAAYADNSALLWLSSLEVVHPGLPHLPWSFKKIVSGPRHGDGIAEASLDSLTVDQARAVLDAWRPVIDVDDEDSCDDHRPGPIHDPWRGQRPGNTYLRLSGNGGDNARVILTAVIDDPVPDGEQG
jgi:hypothetical protein